MFVKSFKSFNDVRRKEAGCTTKWTYTEQTSWVQILKYLTDLDPRAELRGRTYSQVVECPLRWCKCGAPQMPNGRAQS